jgi:VWFA-related protein
MLANTFRIRCCAGLLAARLCGAQDSGVVIRSTTNLVQVRLVAEDSKGRPVTDLRQKDFQIFDDGKPQAITLFTSERAAVSPGAPSPSAKPADSPAETDAGYALIVLDWLNTAMADRVMAMDQAIRLLKNFQPRQKVGIYLLGHESRLALDFTSDRTELAQAVEDAGLEFGRLEDAPRGGRSGGGRGPVLNVEEQIFFWQNRVLETLRAFGEIGDMLGRMPGRKAMIWLSERRLAMWQPSKQSWTTATPAIVEGFVGRGWVILSGVHPEAPGKLAAGNGLQNTSKRRHSVRTNAYLRSA